MLLFIYKCLIYFNKEKCIKYFYNVSADLIKKKVQNSYKLSIIQMTVYPFDDFFNLIKLYIFPWLYLLNLGNQVSVKNEEIPSIKIIISVTSFKIIPNIFSIPIRWDKFNQCTKIWPNISQIQQLAQRK